MLKWLIAAGVLYGGSVALLYVSQRSLQYFPERRRTTPHAAGLSEAEEVILDTADSEQVIIWHVPPHEDHPVFLYFHGNGGSLRWRDERFRALIADGSGLVALSYRGYGGSSGRPTETGLLNDAAAAYNAFAIERYPAERIVLWGESLVVACHCSRSGKTGRLRGSRSSLHLSGRCRRGHYWFVPVRLFMKDQFRSDLRARKVRSPVLILHGEKDSVVPIDLSKRLYAMIQSPKRFVTVNGAGHNDLGARAVAEAKQFIVEFPA